MKKVAIQVFTVVVALMLTISAQAQDKPAPSPLGTITQKVGLGEIAVTYSRPGKKDRKVMGELVPYGKLWRTGANARTNISFSMDVSLAGTAVPAGEYSLFSVPGASEWEIILSDATTGRSNEIADTEKTIKFKVEPQMMDITVETFTIMINDIRDDSATLMLVWENTVVPIPIRF